MDLRSMLNEGTAPAAAPPTPSKAPPPPHQHQQQAPPLTPVQTAPPQSFRDYSQSTQASPGRVASHDYPSQQTPFGSPPPYPAAGTPYASRPAPPPLQPLSNNDVRSPSVSSISGPSPSYRHTPTSSVSGVAGYPFPPTQAGPASPAQQHRYPPSTAYPPRDGFSQPPGPGGVAGPPGAPSYMPGQAMPQTPPIGTPGSAHPYLHQRSQSTHSTSTPTSAQSQQQYGPPYGSPVVSTHPLPPSEYARQPSQPPTPLGPPLSAGPRPSPGGGSFAQPPSPYQQRMSATNPYPYQSQQQMSPAPPPPPSLQRTSTNQSLYDAPHPVDTHRRSISQSDRERSVSVSPKTRVPSLPSSTGHQSISGAPPDSEARHLSQGHMPIIDPMDRERAVTPAKRKMEDRDLRPDEIERQERRPPPFEANGSYMPHVASRASASPLLQRKKRLRHTAPPIWAQAYDGRQPLNKGNFIVRKPTPLSHTHVNGKSDTTTQAKHERVSSRHVSPDAARSSVPAPQASQSQPAPVQPPPSGPNPLLGPWEPAITGKKPLDELARQVADFLFMNVIHNQDIGDIQGYVQRGELQWEVEAKLGTLVSKEHQARVYFPITTESILSDSSRIMFVSSMTETQHKSYNDWLNLQVLETDARNPKCLQNPRVPIKYRHRREMDRFYELPPAMRNRLPPPVQNLLNTKHRVKVRVTTDKQSQQVLAKIVKVRVADLDIHFPDTTLDCRISVNLEIDWHDSIQELEQLAGNAQIDRQSDRNKDRLSYSQSHYQIDLTQVTQKMPGPGGTERVQKEHELEIEVDGPALVDHGTRALHGELSAYAELVEGFVDNIRLLARKAKEFGGN